MLQIFKNYPFINLYFNENVLIIDIGILLFVLFKQQIFLSILSIYLLKQKCRSFINIEYIQQKRKTNELKNRSTGSLIIYQYIQP